MLFDVNDLKPGMTVTEDIYIPVNRFIPLLRDGVTLTADMIDDLKKNGVERINATAKPRVVPVALGGKPKKADAPKRHTLRISREVQDRALTGIENLFDIVKSGAGGITAAQVVKSLDSIVNQLVGSFLSDSAALININDLKSYDEYTYHHSLSVAVLSIAIGQALKLDRKRLNLLGKCAMMHDIGKTKIPIEIINKPAKLTESEFAAIKNHSPEGYRYLLDGKIGDDELWKGVLFHHEKFDGTGYPLGLKGEQIPLMSRIISVADVYDALTSNRPYRVPMQPAEAVEYIMGNTETMFDHNLVVAFMNKIELYPVGNRVELSNGQVYEVVDNENSMRPIVKHTDTGRTLDLYCDLSCLNLTITRLL